MAGAKPRRLGDPPAKLHRSNRERKLRIAAGTRDDPWHLKTAAGSSAYAMFRDEEGEPPALVCQVGSTTLKYHLRAVEDLHSWLLAQGEWVDLGSADENKHAQEGSVEAWAALRTIPSAAGTAFERATGDALACTCPRSSNSSGSHRSPTRLATTRCAGSNTPSGRRSVNHLRERRQLRW